MVRELMNRVHRTQSESITVLEGGTRRVQPGLGQAPVNPFPHKVESIDQSRGNAAVVPIVDPKLHRVL